jgi:hypothetical protein
VASEDAVSIELSPPELRPAAMVLRVRRPDGRVPVEVLADGRPAPFHAATEAVRVPGDTRRVELRYARVK